LINRSSTIGALRPLNRSPAMKVLLLQCPSGAPTRSRSPLRRPATKRGLVGGSPVDENSLGGIKFELNFRTSRHAVSGNPGDPVRACTVFFLKLNLHRSRNVHIVPKPAVMRRSSSSRCCIFSIAMSGFGLDERQQEIPVSIESRAADSALLARGAFHVVTQSTAPN
jgi:hypothetical protein